MNSANIIEVVDSLIGPVEPLGDSSRDKDRLYNLKKLEDVTNHLMERVLLLKPYIESYEGSVRTIGEEAVKCVECWMRDLNTDTKTYKCDVWLSAEDEMCGTVLLTKNEYYLVKYISDVSNWNNKSGGGWCGSFGISCEELDEMV